MSTDIMLVILVLALTMVLFILEVVRVDLVAILVMLLLAWLRLVPPQDIFSGFASNAVMAMIGVMILGYGLDRSGAMNRVTQWITRIAGASEKRLLAVIATAVGLMSAFMQNIGAVILFFPSVLLISRNNRIHPSRLLMPIGFAAILGGTLSMVGSGPLIILNDLLAQGGQDRFGLFSVTPLGLMLLAAGLLYFLLAGSRILPARSQEPPPPGAQQRLIETWHLPSAVHYCRIPATSPLIGQTREEVRFREAYGLNLLALREDDELLHAPWRHTRFVADHVLILLGERESVERLAAAYRLQYPAPVKPEAELAFNRGSGFAELIIPPHSTFSGRTIREIALRKTYGVEPLMLIRGDREERGDLSDMVLQAGDDLIVHGPWPNLRLLGDERRGVLASPVEAEPAVPVRPRLALICFLGAIALALTGVPLSLALITGALVMILGRVITIDEAYRAVEWRTVFLLAGLIPLGLAMERTGTAAFLADHLMLWLKGGHPLVLLTAVAVLATLFTLFMSNVAATVLLVPLVMTLGKLTGVDGRALALLVAVCASNSFLLPTHQVNALLMSPGGYRNLDYLKAGGLMTVLFIAIAVVGIYLLYL
ncbi:MAG TPA: SLC13 family permease [Acidobacteriota bacterium]|nr:SLC13 family permease [Acidobacteriota bacterium]